MNTYKINTIFVSLFLSFFITLPLPAQSGVNPQDSFYTNAKRWELLGLTKQLPTYRPYPAFIIESILNDVTSSDDPVEKAIAESYRTELFNHIINPYGKTVYSSLVSEKSSSFNQYGLQGNLLLSDACSFSYWGAGVMTNTLTPVKPYGTGPFADYVPDTQLFGKWVSLIETNTVFSFGKQNLYLQSGISRTGYGENIDDGLVLSPQAFHAPYILFNANNDRLRYTQSLFRFLPTDGNGVISASTDEKLMSFHSVEYTPFTHLSISYYESMIFGHRLELSYLLPSLFITSQAFSYFSDNLLMGVNATYRTNNISLYADLYIDDLSIGSIVKLNPEARFTHSQMIGINYAPQILPSSLFSCDYTLVTPWMYGHNDGSPFTSTVNYQNCTNNGSNSGTQLDPNSHRINLKVSLSEGLLSGFSADFSAVFIQHGNISETLATDEAVSILRYNGNYNNGNYKTDGSINQQERYYTLDNEGNKVLSNLNSYLNKFQFLEQDTIKSVLQLTSNVAYNITFSDYFKTNIGLSYTFEYIRNDGVERDIFTSYSPDASAETVQNDLTNWRNGIIPETFNNYVTVSCKIVF